MTAFPVDYLPIRIFVAAVCAVLLWLVQKRLSRAQLSYRIGLVWTAAFLLGLALACVPQMLVPLAQAVGTVLPSNLLFFGAIVFLTVITFMLSLKSAQHSRAIARLVQEIGILEHELDAAKTAADAPSADSPE